MLCFIVLLGDTPRLILIGAVDWRIAVDGTSSSTMEAYNQNSRATQATQTQLQQHNGKTLVTHRPFTDPSQTYRRADFLDDANEDRRQSATSLNKKRPPSQTTTTGTGKAARPKARPRQRKESSSPEPTTRRKEPNAEELVSKWQRVSQTALSDSDSDDMRFDLSGKLPRLKLYLSPESRTKSLASREEEREYIFVSQDGTQVSSSAPRKDLQLEVRIGRGDGESVVSSASSSAGLPAAQGGFAPPSVGSVKASQKYLRDGSIGYSSDSEGGRRDDSFLGDRRRLVPLSKAVPLQKGKGKAKVKERVTLGEDSESEIEVVGKGKAKAAKGKGKVEEKNGRVKGSVTNLTKLATSKRDGKRKEPPAPPPATKRPATVQRTKKTTKTRKRVVLDTSEEEAESEDDISITPRAKAVPVTAKGKGKAPVRREKTPLLKTGKTSKRARERTPPPPPTAAAGKSKKNNKRKRLTLDDEGPVISSADSDSAPAPTRRKISKQVRTPIKNAKPKRTPAEVAIPSGFPSPMRAPVRVNEALLKPVEEPVLEVVVKKYRMNATGEEEEIVYGPNG